MVQLKSISLLSFASFTYAKTLSVDVGSNGDNFSPDSVTADVGDVVEFKFNGRHSVSQSAFDSPCVASGSSVINSGIMSTGTFSVLVNSTDPIYYFCAFARHCQGGQVGVINGPTSGNTLASYKSASEKATSVSAPSGVQNGILGDASGFGSAASGSSASSSLAAITTAGNSASTAAASLSAAESTLATATGSPIGTTTGSGTSATSSSSANMIKAAGVVGFAGLFAALLA